MALKIGITGGIGSGKSFIAHQFESFGVPVYYADTRAKWLMNHQNQLIENLKQLFGESLYESGQLNRPYLANIVFKDTNLLSKLNELVHPAVEEDFNDFCLRHPTNPYVLKEAALLFETGNYLKLDKTILITCNKEKKIERVIDRDKVTRLQVELRMNHQWEDEQKIPLATYLLNNDENSDIEKEVKYIHQEILKDAIR